MKWIVLLTCVGCLVAGGTVLAEGQSVPAPNSSSSSSSNSANPEQEYNDALRAYNEALEDYQHAVNLAAASDMMRQDNRAAEINVQRTKAQLDSAERRLDRAIAALDR